MPTRFSGKITGEPIVPMSAPLPKTIELERLIPPVPVSSSSSPIPVWPVAVTCESSTIASVALATTMPIPPWATSVSRSRTNEELCAESSTCSTGTVAALSTTRKRSMWPCAELKKASAAPAPPKGVPAKSKLPRTSTSSKRTVLPRK